MAVIAGLGLFYLFKRLKALPSLSYELNPFSSSVVFPTCTDCQKAF